MRTGPVHRARKLHLHHRLEPVRNYTYDPAGNLLTDSYRTIFQSTMGRANLPFTLMKGPQGAQYREAYLYNTADQRIYKEEDRYAQGSVVSQEVTSEFHLLDAGGHDLGVLDLNTGKWEWYIFGAQRFAKLTPANDQQPAFVSTDLSGLAPEPKPGEVELENLLNCLGSLVGNTQLYPLTLVRYKTGETEPVKYDEQSVFNAIPASAQATIIPVGHPLSFRSGKDRLTLSTDPRSSYSIDALMKMAMQRNGPISFPFAYTYPANTALNKVTYYEHDHLGNLRVAFTPVVDCSNPTGTEPDPGLNHANSSFTLDQVVDYFPYGKILRQYVASNGPERYLTTQHERDQETGLDYRGARYYDSDVARFLSLDPKAADYASWSPYNYVMGNPISLTDPTGRNSDYYQNAAGEIKWFDNTASSVVDQSMTSWTNIGTAHAAFNGTSLTLNYQTNTGGNLAPASFTTPAVSGRPGVNGTFDYSPDRQAMADTGPIPEGSYSLDPSKIRELTFKDELIGKGAAWTQLLGIKTGAFPGGSTAWGMGRMPIEPNSVQVCDPSTSLMVTRDKFTVHGGTSAGSAGCIDLMRGESRFFSMLQLASTSPIKLTVDYKGLSTPVVSPFNADGTGFSNEPPLKR